MSDQRISPQASDSATSEEMMAALFAQLVLQQTNMAMMLLGKVPHPESGQTYKDVEAARLFIDQLEMLETKTKGNLSKEESALLRQSLMNLRLAYVDTVETPQPTQDAAAKQASAPDASAAGAPAEPGTQPAASAAEEEHRKKFSKKY